MESGIKEYWIIDPKLKAVRVFNFRDYDLAENAHFAAGERAESFLYPGLSAGVDGLLE